jgi:ABC-type polysaccharide/polyol phosphate export permease
MHAYYRDVQPILAAVLLPWFFLSPIFFQPERLPGVAGHEWLRIVLTWVNPIAPFIDSTRSVLYGGVVPDQLTLLYVVIAAVATLLFGLLVFRRLEGELAVVV